MIHLCLECVNAYHTCKEYATRVLISLHVALSPDVENPLSAGYSDWKTQSTAISGRGAGRIEEIVQRCERNVG